MVKTKQKAKAKTPKIVLDLKKVEQVASRGLSNEQTALALGISPRTLYNRKRDSAEFAEAMKKGKAKGIDKVASALMKKIMGGDTTAMIFFLKTQGGWKETTRQEVTGADGAPIQTAASVELTERQKQLLDKVLDEEF